MALWESARPPAGFREVWCQELRSHAHLAVLRARLRSTVTGSPAVVDPQREHWSERLVLVADELTSNALRHGTPPVATTLSRSGGRWLLAVTDASTSVPPSPAEDRDPGLGGFGLYIVADIAAEHGWSVARGAKTVWAVVAED